MTVRPISSRPSRPLSTSARLASLVTVVAGLVVALSACGDSGESPAATVDDTRQGRLAAASATQAAPSIPAPIGKQVIRTGETPSLAAFELQPRPPGARADRRDPVVLPAVGPMRSDGNVPGSLVLDPSRPATLVGGAPIAGATCDVDFDDPAAKTLTGPSAWMDRIYVPWFQICGSGQRVDIRPLLYGHVHLGFRDFDVADCLTESATGFPMKRVDGVCQDVDIATEPRTYIMTHDGSEIVQIRAYTADWTQYQRTTFDLERIRIRGSEPVRLCYRQHTLGDFVTAGPSGDPWDCFESLEPGYYDLSGWVKDATEVTVTGPSGPYAIDDLRLSISPVGY